MGNLGVVINASIHGLQESVDNFGVFDALDDMVQTVVGGVPEKINSLIMPIGDEEEIEEERPEIRDNLVVETHENFEPIEPKFFDNMFDMGSPVEEEVEEVKEVKDEFIADEMRDVDPRLFNVEEELVVVPDVEVHVEPLMVDEILERSDFEEEVDEYQVVPRSFA